LIIEMDEIIDKIIIIIAVVKGSCNITDGLPFYKHLLLRR